MSKPTKTIIDWTNAAEMCQYKEQRNFRTFKDKGHYYFDKIWANGLMTRQEAYSWLARMLGVEEPMAHFSKMTDEMCKEAIYFCQQALNDNRRLDLDFGVKPITPLYVLD